MEEIQRREWGRRREERRAILGGFHLVRDTLLDLGFVSFSDQKEIHVSCFHR